jgi:hypothetical protein
MPIGGTSAIQGGDPEGDQLNLNLEQFFRTDTFTGAVSEDVDGDGRFPGQNDVDSDNDGVSDACEGMKLGTNPMNADSDNDGVGDHYDTGDNPGQLGGPLPISNGTGVTPGEKQHNPARGVYECHPDGDADGRTDLDEENGTGCGGEVTDVSDDTSAGPTGGATSWDTDGDVVPDGVECSNGSDPTTGAAGDRTTCNTAFPSADADADGLDDQQERCKWNTSISDTNTDDDAVADCREAMDVNGNGSLTNGDATLVQQAFFNIIAREFSAMDINGNNTLTNGDATIVRQRFFGVASGVVTGPCL